MDPVPSMGEARWTDVLMGGTASAGEAAVLWSQSKTSYDLGALTDARFDITAMVVQVFVMATVALLTFPAVAAAAIDAVVSQGPLASSSDGPRLTYRHMFVEYALKWRAIAPNSFLSDQ